MKSVIKFCALAVVIPAFSGCAVGNQALRMQADVEKSIQTAPEPPVPPVVTATSGSWLMGQSISIARPPSPILETTISYESGVKISLADIAGYITLKTHLPIDISEVTQMPAGGQTTGGQQSPLAMPGIPPGPQGLPMPGGMSGISGVSQLGAAPMSIPGMPGVPGALGSSALASGMQQQIQPMLIAYSGTVSGLLDLVANKSSVWWKFVDGRVVFYRSETKTFYLPTNARKSTGNNTITTTTGAAGGSAAGGAGGAGGSTGVSSTSGATATNDYTIDFWGDVDKTLKVVAAGASTASNPSTGSVTVTGSPAQVRAVSEWVKSISDQLSQQVSITVHMYTVKITKAETYNWDPSILFKKTAGTYGYNLTPASPLIPVSGATPASLAVSVLAGATGATAQYSGSQAALQALSTIGNVSETLQQSVVTMNGQPAPIQVANQQGYLASSSTTAMMGTGAMTSLTPGTVTTGFTATFLPRIVNGKILLDMTMTNSALLGITTQSNASSSIQTTNVDSNTFQQSVSLTPGDALLLTGLQQNKTAINNSGVGSATNAALGGGVDNNVGKTMIAIVVSARVL